MMLAAIIQTLLGKYGPHVQHLLKKAATLDIKMICPLHGPVWRTDLRLYFRQIS